MLFLTPDSNTAPKARSDGIQFFYLIVNLYLRLHYCFFTTGHEPSTEINRNWVTNIVTEERSQLLSSFLCAVVTKAQRRQVSALFNKQSTPTNKITQQESPHYRSQVFSYSTAYEWVSWSLTSLFSTNTAIWDEYSIWDC